MTKIMKAIVFDLDETLGQFTELGIFLDAIEEYFNVKLDQNEFNNLLDMFPEFIRPNIFNILSYLIKKRRKKHCNKIMIYTNNTGAKEWTYKIRDYFNYKLNDKVFDQTVCAFKVNGEQVEMNRTTYNKTYEDLVRCTHIPNNTKVCFIDDQYHDKMANEHVVYIHVVPYYYNLSFEEMASRYANKFNIQDERFVSNINSNMRKYNYTPKIKRESELQIDNIVGKTIMKHLHEFLKSQKKTRKKEQKNKKNKKTKKL